MAQQGREQFGWDHCMAVRHGNVDFCHIFHPPSLVCGKLLHLALPASQPAPKIAAFLSRLHSFISLLPLSHITAGMW